MIPYAIAILLTILTFPKPVALIAIYTLAIADPLAAIVGIRWGGRELAPDRSIEGMLAFFTATLAVSLAVLGVATSAPYAAVAGAAFLIAVAASAFELFPAAHRRQPHHPPVRRLHRLDRVRALRGQPRLIRSVLDLVACPTISPPSTPPPRPRSCVAATSRRASWSTPPSRASSA